VTAALPPHSHAFRDRVSEAITSLVCDPKPLLERRFLAHTDAVARDDDCTYPEADITS
jgi:hypothetical protein